VTFASVNAVVNGLDLLRPRLAELAGGGTVSDEDQAALDFAGGIIGAADVVAGLTGEPWATAATRLIAAVPYRVIVQLFERWRDIAVRAEHVDIAIGPLGADVEVEARG
jgi:hypothetical protein